MALGLYCPGVILYLSVDKDELPRCGESKRKGGQGTWLRQLCIQPESFFLHWLALSLTTFKLISMPVLEFLYQHK